MFEQPPHLVHIFPAYNLRGPQVRTAGLINHFGMRYRHTIVTLDREASARDLIDPDLDVGVVGPPPRVSLLPLHLVHFRRWLRQLQPDLLLTYDWAGMEAALANLWLPLAPQIHHEDGFGDDEQHGQKLPRRWARRLILPQIGRIVVPSRTLEVMARSSWHVPVERLRHIPNGIDLTLYEGPPEPDALPGVRRLPGELLVGAAAAFYRVKNLERLVRAFATAPNRHVARLVIVGDGPQRGAVIEEVVRHELESQTLLPGQLDGPHRYMRHFDIFAISSDTEQMPLSVVEAMAAGLPVIGTDVGDIRQMVSEPNRDFIVDRNNEAALAAKLDALLRDGQLRTRLGRANRAKARADFTFERMAESYASLYDEVLMPQPVPA
jgi:glycosyltransferase involved in cell wall biosynthesis